MTSRLDKRFARFSNLKRATADRCRQGSTREFAPAIFSCSHSERQKWEQVSIAFGTAYYAACLEGELRRRKIFSSLLGYSSVCFLHYILANAFPILLPDHFLYAGWEPPTRFCLNSSICLN